MKDLAFCKWEFLPVRLCSTPGQAQKLPVRGVLTAGWMPMNGGELRLSRHGEQWHDHRQRDWRLLRAQYTIRSAAGAAHPSHRRGTGHISDPT